MFSPRKSFRPDREGRVKLRWESFAHLLPEETHLLYEEKDEIQLLLNECDLIGHDGLLWVLSVIRWREASGLGQTYITLPTDERALSFLVDLGFPDHVSSIGGFITNEFLLLGKERDLRRPDGGTHHPHSPRYIQRVDRDTWGPVFDCLNAFFVNELLGILGDDGAWANLFEESGPYRQAMSELIINVALHGAHQRGDGQGYVCYRPFPRGYPILRFCCTDMGPGFKETLEKYNDDLEFQDELAATEYALLYRFFKPIEGVIGLYRSLPFIRGLAGKVMIRSLDASLALDFSDTQTANLFDEGFDAPSLKWIDRLVTGRREARVPGCHICLDLRSPGAKRKRGG